jgi:excinuclease ABC subunit B
MLLGVTGSGKTFTMANVIANVQKPTLVISHNKTLAAQLASEFKEFFPNNAVEYFVSYYDYYQPEAYIPQTDTYIAKDAKINDQIDKIRHSATCSVLSRRDVIVCASVSCIYGLGSPEDYQSMHIWLEPGMLLERDDVLRNLVSICYQRDDIAFARGRFRVRGDVVEVFPASEENKAIRLEFFGDCLEKLYEINPVSGRVISETGRAVIYPASHYVAPRDKLTRAISSIKGELAQRLAQLRKAGKLLEAQRLETRTLYDIELMEEIGYCPGIENYSRHLSGRAPGEPPAVLLDYFPEGCLIFVDESHVTIPQLRGMYKGDRSRKLSLVEHGFRLPSAFDNRPLRFKEFEGHVKQVVYVSATPGPYEIKSSQTVVEQIIRPTGLVDPEIIIRPVKNQVDNLINEIRKRTEMGERVLVTTLTKRMAEDLSEYLAKIGIKVHYLHSEIKTLERTKILRSLREGRYDCIVGINLLREGLDLPEVSLVAILDADKEGFLRSDRSLIQTMGRASRNVHGRVVLYAGELTDSIRRAVDETNRRRNIQLKFNAEHNIVPRTIMKSIRDLISASSTIDRKLPSFVRERGERYLIREEVARTILELEEEMREHALNLEFEEAAVLRDEVTQLKERLARATQEG